MSLPGAAESTSRPAPALRVGHRATFLVFAIIAVVCFFRLGSETIHETDEGFAGTRADSFSRHGGWVLSYDDVDEDQPQFRKPPLLYWLVAVLFKVLGHTTWAVRLPTALAGFLSAVLLYRLARGALGEGAALTAALLTCAVPFFVLHIRTAMLDLPVICALLAGLAATLLLPRTWWRPVAVGLCGGAAVMLKAVGGLPAVAVMVLFGLLHHRLSRRAWAEAFIALAVAAILPALWYLAVPPEYRELVVRDLFVGETAKRLKATRRAWKRLSVGGGVLVLILRWYLPAAVCGIALALARCLRRRELLEWLGLTLLITVPLLWTYAAMVPRYHRYLLPAVPFLLSFAAYFALESAASRPAALLLVPFAAACATMDTADPWRFVPAAAAATVLVAVWTGWALASPQRRLIVGVVLLAAIAGASWMSASAGSRRSLRGQPRPETVQLMRQASSLIPEKGKLIVEDGFTGHSLLFYGRRAIQSQSLWLNTELSPGEVRYGVFQGDPLRGIPGIRQEEVGRSGPWRLDRLTVEAGGRPLLGVLLADERQKPALANTLSLLDVDFELFSRGFILRGVPGDAVAVAGAERQQLQVHLPSGQERVGGATAELTLGSGESVVLDFGEPRRIAGIEIQPGRRQAAAAGWIVQAGGVDSVWSELKRIEGAIKPDLTVAASRVRKVARRAVRVRFPSVVASRLRLVRTGPGSFVIARVRVLAPRPEREARQ